MSGRLPARGARALSCWLALALALTIGCRPALEETVPLVSRPRVLAVRGDPAEVAPGGKVVLRALVASPDGAVVAPVAWGLCNAPKPPTEDDIVAARCLADAIVPVVGDAADPTVASITVPADTCRLFGPDRPPAVAGQAPPRPRDPDVTGGYYLPMLARVEEAATYDLLRVTCNLPSAPPDVVREFRARYRPNRNPAIADLTLSIAGALASADAIPAGADVDLQITWTSDDAETFPVYDPAAAVLRDQRESMSVSWFATAGTWQSRRTGRAADDPETSIANRWQAPADGRGATLWAVLRDSRGGVDFRAVTVAPVR